MNTITEATSSQMSRRAARLTMLNAADDGYKLLDVKAKLIEAAEGEGMD